MSDSSCSVLYALSYATHHRDDDAVIGASIKEAQTVVGDIA